MTNLDGKVVLVGGNLGKKKGPKFVKGLGAIIAEQIAASGGKVIVTDLDQEIVDECAKALGVKGIYKDLLADREGKEIEVDHPYRKNPDGTPKRITDMDWTSSGAHELVKEIGKIDVLVNNWDYYKSSSIEKSDSAMFDEMRVKNIVPVFHLLAAVRNPWAEEHAKNKDWWPKVVNVFSFVGKAGMSLATVFSALKGSMIGLTKSISREFGRFAIVNSVAYGPLSERNAQGPPSRQRNIAGYLPTSNDYAQHNLTNMPKVANVVEFMASEASNGICGQTISVDGGLWLKIEM